jgi:hypothetical protein
MVGGFVPEAMRACRTTPNFLLSMKVSSAVSCSEGVLKSFLVTENWLCHAVAARTFSPTAD